MSILRNLALLMLPLLTACSSSTQMPVITDFNTNIDFLMYRSFRWYDGPYLPNDPATREEATLHLLRDNINVFLLDYGLEWKQFDPTDLVASVHSGLYETPEIEQWTAHNWYKPWWGAFSPLSKASMYSPGTLVVDFVDTKRLELVYRALLPGFFDEQGRITNIEGLNELFASAMAAYPRGL